MVIKLNKLTFEYSDFSRIVIEQPVHYNGNKITYYLYFKSRSHDPYKITKEEYDFLITNVIPKCGIPLMDITNREDTSNGFLGERGITGNPLETEIPYDTLDGAYFRR